MSSVCGVLQRDGGPAARREIQPMVDALSHWGPDASGIWTHESVGLGHVLLRNTPESSNEQQPWVDGDGRLAVTADARIDNREELFESLGVPAPIARGMPDCALIAAAYRKWATRCPEFIVGDFAFAVWDAREQHLFCARDFVGIKPFYYSETRDRFLFATEIKGLFAHPVLKIPRTLDERKLAEWLLRTPGDQSSSMYEHVRTLPAAHSLTVSRDRCLLSRYWQPDGRRELRLRSDADYLDLYRELLQRAVESRLRTSYPVATTLSPGLDSSTITWLARRATLARPQPLIALSWAYHTEAAAHAQGQRLYADAVLRVLPPMVHQYVYLDSARAFRPPPALFRFHDGPIRDRRFDVIGDTFQAAVAHGARVILFGLGGDEVATSHGLDYLLFLLFRGRAGALLSEIRSQSRATGVPAHGIVRSELLAPLRRSRPGRLALAYTQTGRPGRSSQTAGRLEFLRLFEARAGSRPDVPRGLAFRNPVRANQIGLAFGGRLQHAMETRYSVSALRRLECRFPMLDRRLIEFSLSLPPEQHRSGGCARRLVRRTIAGALPDAVVFGQKDDPPSVDDWTHYDANADFIRQTITRWRAHAGVTHYLDLEKLEALLNACLDRNVAASGHLERGFLLGTYLEWRAQAEG